MSEILASSIALEPALELLPSPDLEESILARMSDYNQGPPRFSVPANVSSRHVEGLEDLLGRTPTSAGIIDNVYGSLPTTVTGHARLPTRLAPATDVELRAYIHRLHGLGIRFHHTSNAPWSGAMERTSQGRASIRSEAERLLELGVDAFIVANPYLLSLLRGWFPEVSLIASINCRARNNQAIGRLLELGADRVVVEREVNRDLRLASKIARQWGDRACLLVNSTCMSECPYQTYHALETGCISRQEGGAVDPPTAQSIDDPEACFDYCLGLLLENPVAILCAPWIRPEDIDTYLALGVSRFKVQGRSFPVDQQLLVVEAYLRRRTPRRHLMALFPGLLESIEAAATRRGEPGDVAAKFGPLHMDQLEETGFFDALARRRGDCSTGCETCRICHRAFERLTTTESAGAHR